ncbi:unnamed protein product [Nesidiocoris tenuis]|uniref:Uncharacterized protein n=1 Tax=Nesidiocoris tenuis TaxID=355587 RepID=A0A6H5G857_9HEMI|nr:unnamed protein product [Nesidiocoris tenuis]
MMSRRIRRSRRRMRMKRRSRRMRMMSRRIRRRKGRRSMKTRSRRRRSSSRMKRRKDDSNASISSVNMEHYIMENSRNYGLGHKFSCTKILANKYVGLRALRSPACGPPCRSSGTKDHFSWRPGSNPSNQPAALTQFCLNTIRRPAFAGKCTPFRKRSRKRRKDLISTANPLRTPDETEGNAGSVEVEVSLPQKSPPRQLQLCIAKTGNIEPYRIPSNDVGRYQPILNLIGIHQTKIDDIEPHETIIDNIGQYQTISD